MTKQTKKNTMNKLSNKMKNSINILAIFFLIGISVLFQACTENGALNENMNDTAIVQLTDEIDADSNFEEIDDLVIAAMENDFNASNGRHENDERFKCATLDKHQEGEIDIITIDFGEGCEGPHGHVRKGKIVISVKGNPWEPGSSHMSELLDFYIDDVHIEGTRSKINVSESLDSSPKFNITLIDGKITWPDGTFATREADHTRTIDRTQNPIGDQIYVEGQSSGMNKEGEEYYNEIISPIVFSRSCELGKMPIPISGIKQHTVNEVLTIVDFGNGECDNLATATTNGQSKEFEIKFRRRKK